MEYRAVGKRCAVVLESLHLPIPNHEVVSILENHGFAFLEIDIITIARTHIGKAVYKRYVDQSTAPHIVNCSSFTKWLFGQLGMWLPRLALLQRQRGQIIDRRELRTNDLVFTSGRVNYYHDNPADGVGHVGLITDVGTVIHADRRAGHVTEVPLDRFIRGNNFRGARRYFPLDKSLYTVSIPDNVEIETAEDIRYFVLSKLPH